MARSVKSAPAISETQAKALFAKNPAIQSGFSKADKMVGKSPANKRSAFEHPKTSRGGVNG